MSIEALRELQEVGEPEMRRRYPTLDARVVMGVLADVIAYWEECAEVNRMFIAEYCLGWMLLVPEESERAGVDPGRVVEIFDHFGLDGWERVTRMSYREAVREDGGDWVGSDPRARSGALSMGDFTACGGLGPHRGRDV